MRASLETGARPWSPGPSQEVAGGRPEGRAALVEVDKRRRFGFNRLNPVFGGGMAVISGFSLARVAASGEPEPAVGDGIQEGIRG